MCRARGLSRVESSTIEDPVAQSHERPHLRPQAGRVGLEAVQEAGEGVVGGWMAAGRMRRLGRRGASRRGDQEINVGDVAASGMWHDGYPTRCGAAA